MHWLPPRCGGRACREACPAEQPAAGISQENENLKVSAELRAEAIRHRAAAVMAAAVEWAVVIEPGETELLLTAQAATEAEALEALKAATGRVEARVLTALWKLSCKLEAKEEEDELDKTCELLVDDVSFKIEAAMTARDSEAAAPAPHQVWDDTPASSTNSTNGQIIVSTY